eukprot:scaffold34603_cov212-Amphora_coffeaeformis.AAC.22
MASVQLEQSNNDGAVAGRGKYQKRTKTEKTRSSQLIILLLYLCVRFPLKVVTNCLSASVLLIVATFASSSPSTCSLYLSSQDTLHVGESGVKAGQRLGHAVQPIGMLIANYNRDNIPWLPFAWQTAFVGLNNASDDASDDHVDDYTPRYDGALLPGWGMYLQCSLKAVRPANVEVLRNEADGTFYLQALTDLPVGQEIAWDCPKDAFTKDARKATRQRKSIKIDDFEDSLEDGELLCTTGWSNRAPEHGATAGTVLDATTILHLHRFDVAIVQKVKTNLETHPKLLIPIAQHGFIYNQTNVVANQTILESCLAHPDSNLILWPTNWPAWHNNIQHSSNTPNVGLRWSHILYEDTSDIRSYIPVVQLLETEETTLVLELYALRDLQPNEVLAMDYGAEWQSSQEVGNDTPHPAVIADLYNDNWMRWDNNPQGDFITHHLLPNVLSPIRWANTAKVASEWGFRLGLHPNVTTTMVEYANRLGVVEMMQYVTVQGNPLAPSTNLFIQDGEWYLQRPEKRRRSNLHWLSPANEAGHLDVLQALQHAGFNNVLQAIGEYFNMDGLAVYQITFMATSWTAKGWLHWDVINTQGKTYNIIIPLLSAKETGPELDIQDGKTDEVGQYRYEPNVAIMQGDDAVHATSTVDYMHEFRLALSIYISDINEDNLEETADAVTNYYPPKKNMDLFRGWAGIHWDPKDKSKKLPQPSPNHLLLQSSAGVAGRNLTCDTPHNSQQTADA